MSTDPDMDAFLEAHKQFHSSQYKHVQYEHSAAAVITKYREECVKAATAELRITCAELLDELNLITKGESCDHSVGICWCKTFRAMETATALLARTP